MPCHAMQCNAMQCNVMYVYITLYTQYINMHISIYILRKIWTGWWGHLRWCNACVRSIWDFSQEMLVVWAASVMFPAVCSCKQGSGGCADKTQRQNCTENWLSSHFYPMGYTIMFCRPIPTSCAKLCDHTYAVCPDMSTTEQHKCSVLHCDEWLPEAPAFRMQCFWVWKDCRSSEIFYSMNEFGSPKGQMWCLRLAGLGWNYIRE